MSDPWQMPTPDQIEEIYRIARFAAAGAGVAGPDLDDVTQNVAERLTKKWNEPHVVEARSRKPEAWQAYVVVAARNACRDFLRRERRLKAREERAHRPTDGPDLPIRPNVRRPLDHDASTMNEYLARRLIVDLIEECLEARTRLVAILTYVEGLSTREISTLLGMSIRSVNQNKQAARDQLRRRLGAGGQEPNKN
ncbi:MAG: sigma-70 family RNA polymerase sigma factor [Acidimicrobiales bacterium]